VGTFLRHSVVTGTLIRIFASLFGRRCVIDNCIVCDIIILSSAAGSFCHLDLLSTSFSTQCFFCYKNYAAVIYSIVVDVNILEYCEYCLLPPSMCVYVCGAALVSVLVFYHATLC